nr:MAG TPA: acyl carrier protein [Caudoviricetes sp.]
MKEKIHEEILNLLKKEFGIVAGEKDLLKDDLGMDTLSRVNFAVKLEKKFDIDISSKEIDFFAVMSVGDVINLTGRKVS